MKYHDLDEVVRKSLFIIREMSEGKAVIWYGKTDLKSAFHILGTHPSVWWLMIMTAQHPVTKQWVFFINKCLPFGHSMSCTLFQKFSDALAHIHRFLIKDKIKRCGDTTNYLDDFLFLAMMQILCNFMLSEFLTLCKTLQIPVALDKTEWASTIIVFLGILLGGEFHILSVPKDK